MKVSPSHPAGALSIAWAPLCMGRNLLPMPGNPRIGGGLIQEPPDRRRLLVRDCDHNLAGSTTQRNDRIFCASVRMVAHITINVQTRELVQPQPKRKLEKGLR